VSDQQPKEISSDFILLVEGNDETNFFNELLKYMEIIDVQTWAVGGKAQFPNELPAFLLAPNFEQVRAYAIIRDADTSANSTLESIQGLLNRNNQPCPARHGEFAGNEERNLKVGIYIMPGNAEKGMLEDLCLQSVMQHRIMPFVEAYIEKVQSTMGDEAPKNVSKAKLQTFLAGTPRTDERLGLAAKWKYFPMNHPAFSDICDFIRRLRLP
jgi:hypothetical protein